MSAVWLATASCCCLVLSSGSCTARRNACFTGLIRCRASGKQPPEQPDHSDLLPDISSLSPELQQQWHVGRNAHFGGIKIKPKSNKRAVWECEKCPAGQPHIWSASIYNRSSGTKCPYCQNRKVCLHNSLATVPQVAKYWNHRKNNKAPHQVLAGSGARAEWKCPDCKWEWQAVINQRTCKIRGCPKCSSRNRKPKRSYPTFDQGKPPELADWDHERNAADGIFPCNTSLCSNKLVHWTCKHCPKGQLHRYQAMARYRSGEQQSGCPYCAGKLPCVCNSLESLHPLIAAEMDCNKNGFTAAEVLAYSHKKVWWRDQEGHTWEQNVQGRTDKRLTKVRKIKDRQGKLVVLAKVMVVHCVQPTFTHLHAEAMPHSSDTIDCLSRGFIIQFASF